MPRDRDVVSSRETVLADGVARGKTGTQRKAHARPPALGHLGLCGVTAALRYRAENHPQDVAFVHLLDGETKAVEIAYQDLYFDSLAVAHLLAEAGAAGKRVLLLFDPGFAYVSALFGAFLAEAVAVPSFPPLGSRALERLATIIADAEPHLILTSSRFSKLRERVLRHLQDFPESRWIDSDQQISRIKSEFAGADAQAHLSDRFGAADPTALALLQYTSGSTSEPKGVMLTQANLLSNCEALSSWTGSARPRVGCTWLPPYHDMGLMGGILLPLYEGFSTVIMSPGHFVQRPSRWLTALSRYRVTTTVAPNFALDLCVNEVPDDDLNGIDLSAVRELYCGAEPIRRKTFERFARRFARLGFQADSISPCYGLAEATLFVSGKLADTAPRFVIADGARLAHGEFFQAAAENPGAITLASCGVPAPRHRVRIVDPEQCVSLRDGQVGEIWVNGDNVAIGYWQKHKSSEHTFGAKLAGQSESFMRTGDLGFLFDGELYVTGRLKDLIIVAGRNLYPQDIELAAQEADARIRANGVVAFSLDAGATEQIALVVEIRRGENPGISDLARMKEAIVERVTQLTGVAPAHVHFAPPTAIPVTTSGKVQRQAVKRAFIDQTLSVYRPKSSASERKPQPASEPDRTGADDRTGARERALAWFTVGLPVLGTLLAVVLAVRDGVSGLEIALLAVMYLLTALGVEVGMHRFFSHRAFKAGPGVTAVLAILGSMAAQGPLLFWAATHRQHHAFTDREGDPHSPQLHDGSGKGRLLALWHAHIGWLFTIRRQNWSQYTQDLLGNRLVVKLNAYYFIWIALGLGIPAVVGWLIGGTPEFALKGLLWGGLMRIFLLDQATWAVNSLAHTFGARPHQSRDGSRNISWLMLFTVGGSWHNNHHAYPALARTGLRPGQIDIAGAFIELLASVGLAWDVKRMNLKRVN